MELLLVLCWGIPLEWDDDIELGCKCETILNGEVAELAEGARLLSVCRFTPTEGSNPSLSATI